MLVEDFLALSADQRSLRLEKIAADIVSLLPRKASASPGPVRPAEVMPREPVAPPAPPLPRAAELFVGRKAALDRLARLMFPAGGARRPAVVSGMPGVGKSYLVDRFYWDHREQFPSGYLLLSLDPDNPPPAAELIAQLAGQLKLPSGDGAALTAHLLAVPGLIHIENADTDEAARVAAELARHLPGCAVVISARHRGLSFGFAVSPDPHIELHPFDEATALAQLAAELGAAAPGQEDWPALAAALGFLPLALHLAAGHLWDGAGAAEFLERLRRNGFSLEHVNPADHVYRQRSRALIRDTFDLSLAALRRNGGARGAAWRDGFAALGHAPSAGVGASLGAAIAGLDPGAFDDMAARARRLSLLDRVTRGTGRRGGCIRCSPSWCAAAPTATRFSAG